MKAPVLAVILAAYVAPAHAGAGLGVECTLVEDDLVQTDGLLDDWAGIPATEGRGFSVRCAQTASRLQLAIHVDDATVIRTSAKPRNPKQDRLTVSIGAAGKWSKLVVLPGTRGFEPVHRWRGARARDDVAANGMQRRGWAVEASLPLEQLASWGPGTPKLHLRLDYRDRGEGGRVARRRARGTIRFAGATDIYRAFMAQTHLRRKDVRVDTLVDLDGERGVERVIVGGTIVGVIGDEYSYLTLPVQAATDVIDARVMDLGGDGRASVITQYREHGNGGSRDVLAVWNLQPNGSFARSLAIEVRKQLGDRVLVNDWELRPHPMTSKRDKRRKRRRRKPRKPKTRGRELVVRAGAVAGWDARSFDDVPPEDMRPILTPWGEQTSAVYWFEGGQAFGGEPE